MNKKTLRTVLLTVGAMLLLFKLATKNNWIGNSNSGTRNNKNYPARNTEPNKHKRDDEASSNTAENGNSEAIARSEADVEKLHLFDHKRKLIFTKHAKCRMDCRHFTEAEVQEILQNGKVNFNKSNDRKGDCPTYALEGETSDGQQARMVFALCDYNTAKVITVIDLDTDWQCACY